MGTPLLPIERVDDPPESFRYEPDRFFARVPVLASPNQDQGTIEDIDGMSGGPVFAVQFTDAETLRYWVVAIQSKWLPDSRIIAACPIQPLADAISESIASHSAEIGDEDPLGGE